MGDLYSDYEELCQATDMTNAESPMDIIYDFRLANERIFYVDYDIDNSLLLLQKQIIDINLEDNKKRIPPEKRKPIKILISSYGGYLDVTMSLVATIKQSITPVWTINIACAYSASALLLMAGKRRFALPYSMAMIHNGSNETTGTYEQIMEHIEHYKLAIKGISEFILEITKIKPEEYEIKKAKDWYMTDEEQLAYGLVDEITDNIFKLLEA